MTPASMTSRALPAPVSALWAAATWRATANVLAGLLAALAGVLVLGPLALLWGAAIISLVADWPAGGPAHVALYVAVVIVFPVLTPWLAQGPTALQRSRLRATLGAEIPPPARTAGRAP